MNSVVDLIVAAFVVLGALLIGFVAIDWFEASIEDRRHRAAKQRARRLHQQRVRELRRRQAAASAELDLAARQAIRQIRKQSGTEWKNVLNR